MKYTEQANEVIKIARSTARKLKHPYVGTEHLLLGLREVYTGVAGQVLGMNGVNEESIRISRRPAQGLNTFWKKVRQRRFISVQTGSGQNTCFWLSCGMRTVWRPVYC